MKEGKPNSAQMRTNITERIVGDVMNQVVRMDVDNVEGWLHPSAPGLVDSSDERKSSTELPSKKDLGSY